MKNFSIKFFKLNIIFLLFFFIIFYLNISYANQSTSAEHQIKTLLVELSQYVEHKNQPDKKQISTKKIKNFLNLDFMARATTGHYWKKADQKQKSKYKQKLLQKILHSIDLHTNRLKKLRFIKTEVKKRGKKLIYVKGKLYNNTEKEIDIVWKLYSKDFSIIDLQIEKISLIKTQKSETINLLRKYKGNFKDF